MIGRDEDVNANAWVQMPTLVSENICLISIFREHNIFAIGDGLAKFAKILCTRKKCDLQYAHSYFSFGNFPCFQKEVLKSQVKLSALRGDMWSESHDATIANFLQDSQRLMVVYIDSINGLSVDYSIPPYAVNELTFFIKRPNSAEITAENFLDTVQCGSVSGNHIESLLRLMMGVYSPIFFGNTMWPDSIKNDFSAQLHRFLASLTDIRWKMVGKTVLYIPNEGLNLPAEVAAKNKELVQRLESKYILYIL